MLPFASLKAPTLIDRSFQHLCTSRAPCTALRPQNMQLSAFAILYLAYIPNLDTLEIQNLSTPGWRTAGPSTPTSSAIKSNTANGSPFGELRGWGKKLRSLQLSQTAEDSPVIKV